MNDERFDNLIKQKLKQEIEIPEDLNNVVINNINKSNIKGVTDILGPSSNVRNTLFSVVSS